MQVTGFSFIRNAILYDYPIIEAIQSILPICDNFVIAVGKSDDKTLELIQNISSQKIEIIETVWDDSLRMGGQVLAQETDKAFAKISKESDWAFYIQGDEIIHEKYLDTIYEQMKRLKNNSAIDGLLFKYLHFYGSYDYVIGESANWYNREIRVIKNNQSIYSFKDAQGFRKDDNQKLHVHPIDAYVYHYGWVKPPNIMQKKQENFNRYWHDDEWVEKNILKVEDFEYENKISELVKFEGTHPQVMQERVKTRNWKFEGTIAYKRNSLKNKLRMFLKNTLGIEFGWKNYKIKKIK